MGKKNKLSHLEELLTHPAVVALKKGVAGTRYEGQLWLVGGCVRDALLSKGVSNDLDIVIEGDAIELARWIFESSLSTIFPVEYPRFGTALVRIASTDVELVGARAESYDPDSRKPDVAPANLLQDMRRRDFTCNALILNISTGEVGDLLGSGVDDLRAGVLRTPLDPDQTFIDDPLRMLRAVRFRVQLGFDYADHLVTSIRDNGPRLEIISKERIQQELSKMIVKPGAEAGFRDLLEFGLLPYIAPELERMVGVEQGKYHFLDVWEHSLLVLKNAYPCDVTLGWAALLHDVGKPETRTIDENGNTRFFNHENVGAAMAARILTRLKYPNKETQDVHSLVRNHMRLGSSPSFSSTAARRLVRDMGDLLEPLLRLVDADIRALKKDLLVMDLEKIREKILEVRTITPPEKLASPLNGEEVMAATGWAPGKLVGEALHYLSECVIEGQLNFDDKGKALSILLDYKVKIETESVESQ